LAADRPSDQERNSLKVTRISDTHKKTIWERSHFLHNFPLQNADFGKKIGQDRKKSTKSNKPPFWTNLGSRLTALGDDDQNRFFYGGSCRNMG